MGSWGYDPGILTFRASGGARLQGAEVRLLPCSAQRPPLSVFSDCPQHAPLLFIPRGPRVAARLTGHLVTSCLSPWADGVSRAWMSLTLTIQGPALLLTQRLSAAAHQGGSCRALAETQHLSARGRECTQNGSADTGCSWEPGKLL